MTQTFTTLPRPVQYRDDLAAQRQTETAQRVAFYAQHAQREEVLRQMVGVNLPHAFCSYE